MADHELQTGTDAIRSFCDAEIRAEGDRRTIEHFIQPFQTPEKHNSHGEIFAPGTFKDSIKERFTDRGEGRSLVKALMYHYRDMPVGIPESITEDNDGVHARTKIVETQLGDDLLALADLRIVDQVSVNFTPEKWRVDETFEIKNGWRKGLPLIIVEQARLNEYSFLPFASDSDSEITSVVREAALTPSQWRLCHGSMLMPGELGNVPEGLKAGETVGFVRSSGLVVGIVKEIRSSGEVDWMGPLCIRASEEAPTVLVELCEFDSSGRLESTGKTASTYAFDVHRLGPVEIQTAQTPSDPPENNSESRDDEPGDSEPSAADVAATAMLQRLRGTKPLDDISEPAHSIAEQMLHRLRAQPAER